jgi:homoserine O-acetyltransferase/O-succinyltransferase
MGETAPAPPVSSELPMTAATPRWCTVVVSVFTPKEIGMELSFAESTAPATLAPWKNDFLSARGRKPREGGAGGDQALELIHGRLEPIRKGSRVMDGRIRWACTGMLLLAVCQAAFAYDGVVEKRIFEMESYTTVGGRTLRMVLMGYETYGKLSPEGNNAILITPFFGGTSHAAGKYGADDPSPGYWDDLIGPGRPVDTNRFFVISVDGLANPNVKDGMTVTTGPASMDPDTSKRYGMSFPVITVRDFVNVQKALIHQLGVVKLQAVMGASMGGMQAFEWAAAYPDMVERIIPIVGAPQCDAFEIARLESWVAPILLDPHWSGGDYYGKVEPTEGVKVAMKAVLIDTRHPDWADRTFGRRWASPDRDPAESMQNLYAVQQYLEEGASQLAARYDANHLIYQVRAIQLFSVGKPLSGLKAKVLLVSARNDLLFPPAQANEIRNLPATRAEFFLLEGSLGHMDGIVSLSQASAAIGGFLSH